jgi:hypothetical protein
VIEERKMRKLSGCFRKSGRSTKTRAVKSERIQKKGNIPDVQ